MTLWAGRFDGEPDATAFEFGRSFPFDRRLFEDDVTGSIAWAEALVAAGALSADDGTTIVSALRAILADGLADPRFVDGPDEDVHTFVERQLVARTGEVGRRLHTGRSRNEQVSLDLRLYLRRHTRSVQAVIAGLVADLLQQARRAGDALMPAYTHLRRAQPVLVAHFLLAHTAALRRDYDRFAAARADADALPLGSGAVAGTNYAVDVESLAARLGFSGVVRNSIDASADRDFVAAFLHACALLMVHLSRIAEDLIVLTTEEFAFFDLADAVTTGSSLMPQKKNPDPLELVRGKAGRVIGRLTGWLTTMKGLPSGYNKDLQEDKEAVFDSESAVCGALAATSSVVRALTLNEDTARRAAGGLMLATDVADYLVLRGLPFRRAHELVGAMVRQLLAERRDFTTLSLADWRRFSDLFDQDVLAVVTPARSVAARRTPQSTSPAAVHGAISETQTWVEQARQGSADLR
jgi:argininosuccinate lyase